MLFQQRQHGPTVIVQTFVRAPGHGLYHQRPGDANKMSPGLSQTNVEISILTTSVRGIESAKHLISRKTTHLGTSRASTVSIIQSRPQQNPLSHGKAGRSGKSVTLPHRRCDLLATIRIDQASCRMADNRRPTSKVPFVVQNTSELNLDAVGQAFIIVVKKSDELASCLSKDTIAGSGDTTVGWVTKHPKVAMTGSQPGQYLRRLISGTVIDRNNFYWPPGLSQRRPYR